MAIKIVEGVATLNGVVISGDFFARYDDAMWAFQSVISRLEREKEVR